MTTPIIISDSERSEVIQVIEDSIGWALTKNTDRLFSIVANDENFFIFHPEENTTIIGIEAFRELGKHAWMQDAFRATDFQVRELRLNFSESGTCAWFSCRLDDHAEWDGQPIGWDNARWTGVLEKRAGRWVLVQMHFSFATPAE